MTVLILISNKNQAVFICNIQEYEQHLTRMGFRRFVLWKWLKTRYQQRFWPWILKKIVQFDF